MSSGASAYEPVATRPPDAGQGIDQAVAVLGVPFTLCSRDEGIGRVRDMIESGRPHHVVLANAHTLNVAWSDPAYHRVLRDADLVLRDGVGVEMAVRLAGKDPRHNFVGTDFVPALLESLAPTGVRVFLFGAEPGVTERAARALEAQAPGAHVVGMAPGWDPRASSSTCTRRDRTCSWRRSATRSRSAGSTSISEQLDVPVSIGVGALFDYLRPRPARRADAAGADRMMFRLVVEPRRLWRRYGWAIRFVWACA
jgi:N-acetylglucosaminyldiphosphoundecaprenol N-acetyl-beta-D-mannosaminyltransferase